MKERKPMELTYTEEDGFLRPDFEVEETSYTLTKWGRMRLSYLETKKRKEYRKLLFSFQLTKHIISCQEQVDKRIEELIEMIASTEGVTEGLKAAEPLKWVAAMNNIKSRAEEIAIKELIEV